MILKRTHPSTTAAVKRSAFLIGNSRWGGQALSGVEADLQSVGRFLVSPNGGAWKEHEIQTVDSPLSKAELLEMIRDRLPNDKGYFFIYLSGHGGLLEDLAPAFILPGGEEIRIDEFKSVLEGVPALLIADCCQGWPESGASNLNESLKTFSAVADSASISRSRGLFDEWISRLPARFTFASAVSPGQFADESSMGGVYTRALLEACREILSDNGENEEIYGIGYPQMLAQKKVMKETNNAQTPFISGYSRTFQPPFLVKL